MGKYMTIKHLFLLVQQLPSFCLSYLLVLKSLFINLSHSIRYVLWLLALWPITLSNYMLLKLTAPSRLYVCFCYWLVSHRDNCVFFNICKQSSKHSKGLKLCIIYLSGGRKTLHPLCMKSYTRLQIKKLFHAQPRNKTPKPFFCNWFLYMI